MEKEAAYAEIERNGGAVYAKDFATHHPDDPLTPFCHRYLFEQTLRDEAERDAAAATHDDERGAPLRLLDDDRRARVGARRSGKRSPQSRLAGVGEAYRTLSLT